LPPPPGDSKYRDEADAEAETDALGGEFFSREPDAEIEAEGREGVLEQEP